MKKRAPNISKSRYTRGVAEFVDCDYRDKLPPSLTWNGVPVHEALARFYSNYYADYYYNDGKDIIDPKSELRKDRQRAKRRAQEDVHGAVKAASTSGFPKKKTPKNALLAANEYSRKQRQLISVQDQENAIIDYIDALYAKAGR